MSIFWDEPLTEPVALKTGAELHTLLDAAHFVENCFPGPVRAGVLDLYTTLLQASRTGLYEDRRAATDTLILALMAVGLI